MSFRVAVACEDHTLDQHVIKPILEALLAHLGKGKATVKVVSDPRLQGISDLKRELAAIVTRYSPISDLIIIALDNDGGPMGADGKPVRHATFTSLIPVGDVGKNARVVVAIQEMEVWALWGQRGSLKKSWTDIRDEPHPKELYFDAIVSPSDLRSPGKGRLRLVRQSLQSGWDSLATGCPELRDLENEVRDVLDLT